MNNFLLQSTDSIPFVLKKDVVASIDTIPANDFLSYYEYLPVDSSKLFYDIDAMGQEVIFSGIEGLVRPFVHQVGGSLFLVFAFLFLFGAIVFSSNRLSHFAGIRNVFSFDNHKTKSDKEPTASIGVWSKLFYLFQTYIIYSVLFFVIAVEGSSIYYSSNDYLLLYAQILAGFFLFVWVKLLFYRLMEGVFAKNKIKVLTATYLNIFYLAGALGFLPIIAYIYIPEAKLYVFFFLAALFIIGRIAMIVQTYIFFIKAHIGSSYFFVYLCGVEIMPYFLLYKAIVFIH